MLMAPRCFESTAARPKPRANDDLGARGDRDLLGRAECFRVELSRTAKAQSRKPLPPEHAPSATQSRVPDRRGRLRDRWPSLQGVAAGGARVAGANIHGEPGSPGTAGS